MLSKVSASMSDSLLKMAMVTSLQWGQAAQCKQVRDVPEEMHQFFTSHQGSQQGTVLFSYRKQQDAYMYIISYHNRGECAISILPLGGGSSKSVWLTED